MSSTAATNTLISRLLLPDSVPDQAVRKAVDEAQLLASQSTLEDIADVLARSKFDSYLTIGELQELLRSFSRSLDMISIVSTVRACRDP